MFQLRLFKSDGQWFSTVNLSGVYGFTGSNMTRISNAIQKEIDYWDNLITWDLLFDGEIVTDQYLELSKEM